LIYEKLKGAIERGDIESEAILIPFLVPTDSPLLCFFFVEASFNKYCRGECVWGEIHWF
jgi:hypothetical protein